jgi:hypothetical protein
VRDLDRILPIKQAAQGRLLALPGVHAVGIGAKIVGGERTEETAIMVFVVEKKPLAALRPDEVIPADIEGVKTDVYESDVFRLQAKDESRARPLMGGVQIQPGGFTPDTQKEGETTITPGSGLGSYGTLGCLALTGAPQRLIAITCQHVVGEPYHATRATLDATTTASGATFTGSNAPGLLVVVSFTITDTSSQDTCDNQKTYNVFYRTVAADTPQTIAAAVVAQIGATNVPGVTATVNPPGSATIAFSTTSAFPATSHLAAAPVVYDVPTGFVNVGLTASVNGTAIALTGQASRACAAYVNFNVGGASPSYGVFVPIASGATADTLANGTVSAIAALVAAIKVTDPTLTNVTASAAAPTSPGGPWVVSVGSVQEVECFIASDVRVGQPDTTFCSRCSPCCDDLMGTVVDARLDLDVALIQVDPKHVDTYRAEIKDIGNIRGTVDITQKPQGYKLQKRGRTTQVTHGTLICVAQDGDALDFHHAMTPWTLFRRRYTGAFSIQGTGVAFGDEGDSGSAVVTDTASGDDDYNKILGILFAVSKTEGTGLATPIQSIIDAFPALQLTMATADATGISLPVPGAAAAAAATAAAASDGAQPTARLAEAEEEITATTAGRKYRELVERHFAEVHALVTQNRRVGTAWQRNGGPLLARHLLRMPDAPDDTLPQTIRGKPLAACLDELRRAFSQYGSADLAADLAAYGPTLSGLAGMSYRQTLDTLRHLELE